MVADVVIVVMEDVVVLYGSSLSFAAVVAMASADLAIAVAMAVVMTAVVSSGSYLSFVAVVATVSVDAEIPAVNLIFYWLVSGVASQRRFFLPLTVWLVNGLIFLYFFPSLNTLNILHPLHRLYFLLSLNHL